MSIRTVRNMLIALFTLAIFLPLIVPADSGWGAMQSLTSQFFPGLEDFAAASDFPGKIRAGLLFSLFGGFLFALFAFRAVARAGFHDVLLRQGRFRMFLIVAAALLLATVPVTANLADVAPHSLSFPFFMALKSAASALAVFNGGYFLLVAFAFLCTFVSVFGGKSK